MNRIVRRIFIFTVVFFGIITLFSQEAEAEKKIGVLIWTKENHYSETIKGLMEQLKKEGFVEPKVKFTIENAEGNKAKAADLAQKFSAARMDMVITIGTSATVIVSKEIKDLPIVFGLVYDPVEAKIAADWKSSGNNTTGASNKISMSNIMRSLKELAPVKRLGVLYQPGERNSEVQLKDLHAEQNEFQIKVVPVPLTSRADVVQILPEVLGAVDAIYLSGSSIVGESIPTIVDMATKAKVITVTHLEERVEKGVLLAVCADSYKVGLLAGEKASKVLKGANPSSLPIGVLKKLDVILNMKTAKTGHFDIPPSFLKSATKVIE